MFQKNNKINNILARNRARNFFNNKYFKQLQVVNTIAGPVVKYKLLATDTVIELAPEEHTKLNLLLLAPYSFWLECTDNKGKLTADNWEYLAEYCMVATHARVDRTSVSSLGGFSEYKLDNRQSIFDNKGGEDD